MYDRIHHIHDGDDGDGGDGFCDRNGDDDVDDDDDNDDCVRGNDVDDGVRVDEDYGDLGGGVVGLEAVV